MDKMRTKSIVILALLAAVMAASRFDHFGSAFLLPDASYAIFFLGGLYLARSPRASVLGFLLLTVEAGAIDYYATRVLGVSDWCITPAYWSLIAAYAGLWVAGRWVATRISGMDRGTGWAGWALVALVAWMASSFAFIFSNVTFYLFSGRYAQMAATEFAPRVAQYYVPYVSVAMLYILCAIAIEMTVDVLATHRVQSH